MYDWIEGINDRWSLQPEVVMIPCLKVQGLSVNKARGDWVELKDFSQISFQPQKLL